MSPLLWVNILTVAGPLMLSFDKRNRFFKQWKTIFPSVLIVGFLFILWGGSFTRAQIWGFNPDYLAGISYFDIPLEEFLFFLTAPFAFCFIYEEVKTYFPKFRFIRLSYYFSLIFTLTALLFAFIYHDNWYTFVALLLAGLLNWIIYFGFTPRWYSYFIITLMIAMIPFLFLEGILLGLVTENPLSWYDPNEIIGLRVFCIPIEEFYLIFSLNFSVVIVHEFLKKRRLKRTTLHH